MFAVILPSLNFRGNRSPYLWWFYKLCSELGDQAEYVCGDEYFRAPPELLAEGRREASDDVAELYQYHLPTPEVLEKLARLSIPLEIWERIEARHASNPLAALMHYCLENDTGLREAYAGALDSFTTRNGPPEAVITCLNCTALKQLCQERDVPLVHLELGPLRGPTFLQTVYFDFSGVNGNTEAHSRFSAVNNSLRASLDIYPIEALRQLFLSHRLNELHSPDIELGLGLQIEDDSNIVCYACGHSSLSLINHARHLLSQRLSAPPVLVRAHPGSHFGLRSLPSGMEPDQSASSLDFVMRCRQLHVINSGLAVEALLLDRTVTARGDCPFALCIDPDSGRCDATALAFFMLNYLVPWRTAFTPQYIRWRLGQPTEQEIMQCHLENYMQDKIRLLEGQVADLEQQLTELRSSLSWRLSYPVRVISHLSGCLLRWLRR